MAENLFREAKKLRATKTMEEMNAEEKLTVNAAMILLNRLPEYNDTPIDQGLEELAEMVDGKHC